MRRSVFYSAFVALFAVMAFGVAHASATAEVTGKTLTITPAIAKPSAAPGSQASGDFQVLNQGGGSFNVRIYAAPYSVNDEQYDPNFTPLPGRPDPSKWLHFSVESGEITQSKSLDVHYTLTVPAGTQPGGYYAVTFAETQAPGTKNGVVINERVGEIFYIRVQGPVRESGKLLSWSSGFLQKQPLNAALRLENSGGTHYASNVHVVVRDLFGNPKYDLQTQKEILPQTIRRIPISWTAAPPFGLFKVTGNATVLGTTHPLQTKYVLIVSPPLRFAIPGVLLVLMGSAVYAYYLRPRMARKKASAPGAAK